MAPHPSIWLHLLHQIHQILHIGRTCRILLGGHEQADGLFREHRAALRGVCREVVGLVDVDAADDRQDADSELPVAVTRNLREYRLHRVRDAHDAKGRRTG